MTTQTQIVREAPDIEAYKLGLLESAKGLADQPVGLGVVDAEGNPVMEDYTFEDEEGNIQTGQRQVRQLPTMQVAGMSPLQQQALFAAQSGIGNYMPYLQQAGFTMGDAQQALGGALTGAMPFRQQALGGMLGAQGMLAGAGAGIQPQVSQAQQALQQAGAFGQQTAQSGIGQLGATTGRFDPTSISQFMNPFEDAAVAQALKDIREQGDIQAQGQRAQAVGAGAFGGSRAAIAEQQLGKNVLDQQARTAAGMRQAGYQQAAAQAQQAFEQEQARRQAAAQLTGQLGQAGAGSALRAAQAGGQLGLAGQQALGNLAQNYGALAQGIGGLGTQFGQLGLQTGQALGQLGVQQAGLGELAQLQGQKEQGFLFDLGKQEQAQNQAVLEAQRQSNLQQLYEPYQRLGFLSDIYKGAPSSQSTITATTSPSVSPAQSILGLGIAGLSAATGAQKAGLFG
jgi:hypothetical protein